METPADMTVEQRLWRLEAHIDLRELVGRYALAVDNRDLDVLARLFTPDASWGAKIGALSSLRAKPSESVVQQIERQMRGLGPTFHFVHDQLVSFDEADRTSATGFVTAHAEVVSRGQAYIIAMRYADEYRHLDGRWQFAKRELSFFYYLPVAQYAKAMEGIERIRPNGAKATADYPETLPTWRRFYDQR